MLPPTPPLQPSSGRATSLREVLVREPGHVIATLGFSGEERQFPLAHEADLVVHVRPFGIGVHGNCRAARPGLASQLPVASFDIDPRGLVRPVMKQNAGEVGRVQADCSRPFGGRPSQPRDIRQRGQCPCAGDGCEPAVASRTIAAAEIRGEPHRNHQRQIAGGPFLPRDRATRGQRRSPPQKAVLTPSAVRARRRAGRTADPSATPTRYRWRPPPQRAQVQAATGEVPRNCSCPTASRADDRAFVR